MQKWRLKTNQFSRLFKRVNELIMLHAVVKEPQLLQYNPYVNTTMLSPGQYQALDPNDPVTYASTVHWPEPLPVDHLLKLNEVQARMSMGLESKRGALRAMGEPFANQKLNEIQQEMLEDLKEQAAVGLLNAQANQFIISATGMTPDGSQPLMVPGQEGEDGAMMPGVDPQLAQEIMMRAYQQMPPERTEYSSTD